MKSYLIQKNLLFQIAPFLERKSVSECVQHYYLSKKTENYKQLLRKSTKLGRRRGRGNPANNAQVTFYSIDWGKLLGDWENHEPMMQKLHPFFLFFVVVMKNYCMQA